MNSLDKDFYLEKYPHIEEYIERSNIDFKELQKIYNDFVKFENSMKLKQIL